MFSISLCKIRILNKPPIKLLNIMKSFLLLIIALCALACNNSAPDKAHSREIYNAGNQQVITTFANRKLQTMSVLYGNEAVKECALSGCATHHQGEAFTLVVYKQGGNKYWYGSYINGTLKSVETVSTLPTEGKTDNFIYHLQQGQAPTDSLGRKITPTDRTRYILSHQPSVFP
jgi:hypothetical protein